MEVVTKSYTNIIMKTQDSILNVWHVWNAVFFNGGVYGSVI